MTAVALDPLPSRSGQKASCLLSISTPEANIWHVARLTPRGRAPLDSGTGWRPRTNVDTLASPDLATALNRICSAWEAEGFRCEVMRTSATCAHVFVRRDGR